MDPYSYSQPRRAKFERLELRWYASMACLEPEECYWPFGHQAVLNNIDLSFVTAFFSLCFLQVSNMMLSGI
jgi:hypothetical protein